MWFPVSRFDLADALQGVGLLQCGGLENHACKHLSGFCQMAPPNCHCEAAKMELHCRSCKECGDRLYFCRNIAAIMDLEAAAPPESWIEEAAAQFEMIRRELSNTTK